MTRPRQKKDDLYDLWYHADYYNRHQRHNPETDCIEWTAGMHRQGYGMCGAWRKADMSKIMTTTHRIAARLKYQRPIDTYEFIYHTCDNPACVNPDHIEIGDGRQVQLERYRKARERAAK